MESSELIRLATNALLTNKLRSILTTLGVIIGVFAIILLVSLGSGLQKYITSQISGLGSNLLFVLPGSQQARGPGGTTQNKLLVSDAKRVATRLKNFTEVAPALIQGTTAKFKNKTDKSVMIYGTTFNYPDVVNIAIATGRWFTIGQEKSGVKVALIGETVAKTLYPNKNALGQPILIGRNTYTIIGTLAKRGSFFGIDQDNVVGIPIALAQKQFGITNINNIYIRAKKTEQVGFVQSQATKILQHRLTSDDFTIQTQETTLATIKNITNMLSLGLGGVAAIALLVGGIGVANIMLVSVTERTKEIGLRKALGAKRATILQQFLLEAIILSVTGGLLGIFLGVGASLIIAKLFVSEVTPWSIFLAFFFSLAVGVVFGIAPAIKASKLSPIEALRYE